MIGKIRRKLRRLLDEREHLALYRRYSHFSMIKKAIFRSNLRLARTCAGVDGSVVECGVWRGGMIAAMSEVLGRGRKYFLFDSFQGLPEAKDIDGPAALSWQGNEGGAMYYNNCTADYTWAETAMKLAGVNDPVIVAGWFSDTLKQIPQNTPIAMLRLDADWYDSTMQCLEVLYPLVVPRGLIIIDDYYTWDGCSRAVHRYLSDHQSSDKLCSTSEGVCYIRKACLESKA